MALTEQGAVSHRSSSMSAADETFTRELPTRKLPSKGIGGELAHELITSELLLDGQARLNLATFVTTWMPTLGAELMAQTADKNMIDKDEYPQTAAIESHCVNMLADLWGSPEHEDATGTLHHRLERGVHARRDGAEVALARSGCRPPASRPTSPTW